MKTQGPGVGGGVRWEQTCHVGVGAGDKQVLRQKDGKIGERNQAGSQEERNENWGLCWQICPLEEI